MKNCSVLCSNGALLSAYLSDDNRVLFAGCYEEAMASPCKKPVVVNGKDKYYLPKDALDARTETAYVLLPFVIDGKWGYCDRWEGKIVHEPQWGWCGHFIPTVGGRALARCNAKEEARTHSDSVEIFEETFAPCDIAYDGQWGLLTVDGGMVVQPNYQYLSPIKDGVLLAKQNGLWGLIDTFGKEMIPCTYDAICFSDKGNIIACLQGQYTIWTCSGKKLIAHLPAMPKVWEDSHWLFNTFLDYNKEVYDLDVEASRLWRYLAETKCRWYEHDGKFSVLRCIPGDDLHLPEITPFGVPCDSREMAQALVDVACESAARVLHDRAERRRWLGTGESPTENELAQRTTVGRIKVGEQWGYCDLWSGAILQAPEWSFLEPFHRNEWSHTDTRCIARFNTVPFPQDGIQEDSVCCRTFHPDGERYNGRWGLLDTEGNLVVPPLYQYLSPCIGEYYMAKQDNLWGILDRNGTVVVPFLYTGIRACWEPNALFLLREGQGEETRYTLLGYDLEILAEQVTEVPQPVYMPPVYERDTTQENESFVTAIQGKPCRVYYAKCCGSFINPEQCAIWYNSVPEYEFRDAVMTEDGYIRIVERVEQDKIRYITPRTAPPIGGTQEPYAFVCNGQWGYCTGEGKILAYPFAAFCDGMPQPNDDSFCENETPCMRFCLDEWHHLALGDFYMGDPDGMKDQFADGRWGALDEDGLVVIPPIYQYLGRSGQNTDIIIAKKDGFWGALNGEGKPIVPFTWDIIWLDVAYGCLAGKKTRHGMRYAILDAEGKVLIGDLPSVPVHQDGSYDRTFQDGDSDRILHCQLREVDGIDYVWVTAGRMGRSVRVASLEPSFDRLLEFSDKQFGAWLERTETRMLALALVGASNAVVKRVEVSLSDTARAELEEYKELMQYPRKCDVQFAQKQLVAIQTGTEDTK